jgi:imidazolonepropionase-like amidohydrolase
MAKTYLKNVRIIDGTGAPAIEDGLYVFENFPDEFNKDVVEYVGVMNNSLLSKAGKEDNVLDLQGYTMLPGLFNTHVHLDLILPYKNQGPDFDELGVAYRALLMYRRAAEALNCGVTTIRNVGCPDDIDIKLKKAINKNMLYGPNVVTCGQAIIAHGGHGSDLYGSVHCSGVAEFMKAARLECQAGVDQIKLMNTGGMASANEGLNDLQMTDEEIAAVIWVAHAANKKVAAHMSNDKAIYKSVELGLDSVEHGYTLSEKTAEFMAKKGTFFTPTLSVSSSDDYLIAHGSPEHQVRKGREAAKTHRDGVRFAYKHGVKICVGTDLLPSDPVGGTNATVREMEFLSECGMTNLDVIKAATSTAAELCDLQNVTGTLKPGLMGDFLVVEGKPDHDLKDLRNLKLVSKHCRLVWSTLPQMERRRFSVTGAGYEMAGGTFCKWL